MNVKFVKRELNLHKLTGAEINSDVIKIIDIIKNSMSYRIVSKHSTIWCNEHNEEAIEINYKSNCLSVYLNRFNNSLMYEGEVTRELIGFILNEDFSIMDLRLIWRTRSDIQFNSWV